MRDLRKVGTLVRNTLFVTPLTRRLAQAVGSDGEGGMKVKFADEQSFRSLHQDVVVEVAPR